MRILLGLILGFVVALGVVWYLTERQPEQTAYARETTPGVGAGEEPDVHRDVKDTFDPDNIREELSRTGQVVREKVREAGEFVAEVADNATTTATIKAKLLKDAHTSGLAIDVDTTGGVVTLSGKVDSYEEIARAMDLALDTQGVHKVISALQVDQPQAASP